ncbi:LysR family transcriptional regulatory protein [Stappia aggregata IAM 12614]|uniref:LysR family transcriptional regulatory protein n=1 Tax=Roseibium aggregatum (strain ATCC 25650 / DSM 13394 / JCM 20685 / NBRC 16684 / NCIMB 2208 / IAM 12614 / B1) TaxID=384765 RepID=A0NWW8_ROSAI|nr:LysR family transcriptional regulator [Roseibium aggregatum]EAV42604.1 LysR family transcriptional regulatory protein [Stappia aggregata IAM 12614] [Roseibium aggregatum IAM 12614]
MDLQALKTILLVRDLGSLAAAARALDLDASNVSRTVSSVERELGQRLFQRSTRKLSLTEAGEAYLQRVAPLVEEIEAANEDIAARSRQPRGILRMTASVAFVLEGIVPLLPKFQELYPDISIELFPSDSNLDLLAEGLDLAIRLAAAPKGDLISTKLLQTRYRVVASPGYLSGEGHPEAPGDLSVRNCLCFALPDFRNAWRFRLGDDAPFDVDVSGRTTIASALALREAARLGLGPALLADWLIGNDLKEGKLVDLFPAYACAPANFETAAWILYPSRAYLPLKVRVMIDFLKAEFGRSGA